MMTSNRFRQIVDAYGADPVRWPPAERLEAEAFAAENTEAALLLREAATLDRLLDRYAVAPAGAALIGRLAAMASPLRVNPLKSIANWWAGAAFAGLGMAGALAGALTIAVAMPDAASLDADHDGYALTAFDVAPDVDGE